MNTFILGIFFVTFANFAYYFFGSYFSYVLKYIIIENYDYIKKNLNLILSL